MIQKWRTPTNPVNQAQITSAVKAGFIIGTPYADRGTLKISQLLQENRPFACLHPTSLINEIPKDNDGTINIDIQRKLAKTTKLVLFSYNLTWIVHLPDDPEVQDTMVFHVQPTPDQGQLTSKTTTTKPGNIANSQEINEEYEHGCSHLEAQSIVKHSICAFLKTIDHHDESDDHRREVFIGLRSGRTTAPPDTESDVAVPTIPPTVSFAPGTAPPATDGHTLRSGRVVTTTLPDPEAKFSAQYIPPDEPMTPAVLTPVPPLTRWVRRPGYHRKKQI